MGGALQQRQGGTLSEGSLGGAHVLSLGQQSITKILEHRNYPSNHLSGLNMDGRHA